MATKDQPLGPGDTPIFPWPTKVGEVSANADDRWIPWPFTKEATTKLLAEFIGRKVRVSNGPVTQETEPGRITILTDAEGRIVDIYMDPERDLA